MKKIDIMPRDTFFYSIRFQEGQQKLTRELLKSHFAAPKGWKAYMGNNTQYLNFKHGIVFVRVVLNNEEENKLFLHIGFDKINIACNCGMPEGKLCFHAFIGLYHLAWPSAGEELGKFYWPGIVGDEKLEKMFLDIDVKNDRINVSAKSRFGNIFKPELGFKNSAHFLNLLALPHTKIVTEHSNHVFSFCLAHSYANYSSTHLPFIAPFKGVTSKDGNKIVRFKEFLFKDKVTNYTELTSNQIEIIDLAKSQYKIALKYDSLIDKKNASEYWQYKDQMLELWEAGIKLLIFEKFNHSYYTYWIKYIKEKPRKAGMNECRYSFNRPVISFLLKPSKGYFTLSINLTVNGIPIDVDRKPHLLVLDSKTNYWYLMASVMDDELLLWFIKNGNLTILNKHFQDFHDYFLKDLSAKYDVFFIDRQKKKVIYRFPLVMSSL